MTSVLIIEDSSVMRKLLTKVLLSDGAIQRVESVADPYAAWQLLKKFKPDVITLDIELPRMDGLTFLEKLMKSKPMPVVMVSASTSQGARHTLRALELGAVDFIEKPIVDPSTGMIPIAAELLRKVKVAAKARLQSRSSTTSATSTPADRTSSVIDPQKVVAVGASTGGTEALTQLMSALPKDTPGIVIVQHMPARYTSSFAERLNADSSMTVKEATDGDLIEQGKALVAPGDFHIEIERNGSDRIVRTNSDPAVNRFRPSVDVLFQSVARQLRQDAVGVILTGMGCDGARGLLKMRESGAITIAQDEATSVVFGMPKEAIAIGAVDHVRPLQQIASCILRACSAEKRMMDANLRL